MIVNLARHDGGTTTLVPLENVIFEGGEPHVGVTATFALDGREVQARVIEVSPSSPAVPPDPSVVTTVTLEEAADAGAPPLFVTDSTILT